MLSIVLSSKDAAADKIDIALPTQTRLLKGEVGILPQQDGGLGEITPGFPAPSCWVRLLNPNSLSPPGEVSIASKLA